MENGVRLGKSSTTPKGACPGLSGEGRKDTQSCRRGPPAIWGVKQRVIFSTLGTEAMPVEKESRQRSRVAGINTGKKNAQKKLGHTGRFVRPCHQKKSLKNVTGSNLP